MTDDMKEIIERIVPPTPMFGDEDDGGEHHARKTRTSSTARNAEEDPDEAPAEITEEALDEAEAIEPDDERDDAENLGVFYEKDYAERIAGCEFKTELVYAETVDGKYTELEVFYRRPQGSPSVTKWARIGHARSADALDLRRLVRCAELRDERAEERRERTRLIEGMFGAGSAPLVEALIARRDGDPAAESKLTPRQEAFCRHYLTEPSGTRAAIKAGYTERSAANEAYRLMRNDEILQKISALRRAHALSYTLDRDSMLDKLEAFFEDAMKGQSYSAALRALLAQAELSGLFDRRHKAAKRAEDKVRAAAEARADDAPPAA